VKCVFFQTAFVQKKLTKTIISKDTIQTQETKFSNFRWRRVLCMECSIFNLWFSKLFSDMEKSANLHMKQAFYATFLCNRKIISGVFKKGQFSSKITDKIFMLCNVEKRERAKT
jgi:hypothetical protein